MQLVDKSDVVGRQCEADWTAFTEFVELRYSHDHECLLFYNPIHNPWRKLYNTHKDRQ